MNVKLFQVIAMMIMVVCLQSCQSPIGRGFTYAGSGVVSLFQTTPASTALENEDKAEEEKREIGALEANSKSADTQLATANRAVTQAEKNHGKDSDQAFKAREEAILAHERAVNFGFAYIKSKAEVCSMTLRKTDAKLAELKKKIDASDVSPADKKELLTEEEAFGKIAEARETTLKELSKKYDTLRNQFVDTYTGPRTVELEENDEVYLPLADVRLLSLGTTPVAQTQKEEEATQAEAPKAAEPAAATPTTPAVTPAAKTDTPAPTNRNVIPAVNFSANSGEPVVKASANTEAQVTAQTTPTQTPPKEPANDVGAKEEAAPVGPAAGQVDNNVSNGSKAPATAASSNAQNATVTPTPANEKEGSSSWGFWTVAPWILALGLIVWMFTGRNKKQVQTFRSPSANDPTPVNSATRPTQPTTMEKKIVPDASVEAPAPQRAGAPMRLRPIPVEAPKS